MSALRQAPTFAFGYGGRGSTGSVEHPATMVKHPQVAGFPLELTPS
jgi:hypothetical protein